MRISGLRRLRPVEIKAVNDAIAYLEKNFAKPVSAADLCEMFSIPSKKLHLGFRDIKGYSPHQYLNRVRVETAVSLLHNFDLSIKEISAQLGFSDPKQFGQLFKRMTGYSPSEFRQSIC